MKIPIFVLLCSFLAPGLSQICNKYCDDRDASLATNPRVPVTAQIYGRVIKLYISDEDNMAFGEISNGDPRDEVWIDRSMNGGSIWDGKLSDTFIPIESTSVKTRMYNIDNPPLKQLGALRACGKAWIREEIECTSWARSTVNSEQEIDAAALALMQLYDPDLTIWGWWTGANCLTAMIDYFKLTGDTKYRYVIDEVFERNKNKQYGNFTNEYIDDTLWWGLAWVGAFDVTGDKKYLDIAEITLAYCWDFKDDVCGGGVWWTTDKSYKNAITNELFIKLAAALHNRIAGDTKYLSQSVEIWDWFKGTGMINSENLINDGLRDNCENNGDVTWTYNQGVVLGGLVELNKATGEEIYLTEAKKIVDAVLDCSRLNPCPERILVDYGCGNGDCGGDGPSFKGAFVRNLGELDRQLESKGQGRPYKTWLENQTKAIWENDRNSLNQFGLRWNGPFDRVHQGNQHSGFEAYLAAI